MRAQAAACESVQDIINIASTAEALAVTLLGGAINSVKQGSYKGQLQSEDPGRGGQHSRGRPLRGAVSP